MLGSNKSAVAEYLRSATYNWQTDRLKDRVIKKKKDNGQRNLLTLKVKKCSALTSLKNWQTKDRMIDKKKDK